MLNGKEVEKVRTIIAYRHYFEDFFTKLPIDARRKVYKVFEVIESQKVISKQYFEHIRDTDGLYEIKISMGSNTWRVFCFFDMGKLVVLLNGFQKKTQKTPPSEIAHAIRIKMKYFEEKTIGLI